MVDDDIVIATNYGTGNLELDGILYLGGVYKDLYAQLPQEDVKSRHGFEGCIAGLDLNGESPNIMEDAVVHSSLVTAGCEGNKEIICIGLLEGSLEWSFVIIGLVLSINFSL